MGDEGWGLGKGARMKTVEVLMVEDNPGDLVLVREAASKAGLPYHVNVVRDGVEATEYLRSEKRHAGAGRPDLIVLDLKLPRKSGREVLEEITPDPKLRDIPIVLLSSSRSELELVRARHRPGRSYQVKPSTFPGYVELMLSIEAFRRTAAGEEWRVSARGLRTAAEANETVTPAARKILLVEDNRVEAVLLPGNPPPL